MRVDVPEYLVAGEPLPTSGPQIAEQVRAAGFHPVPLAPPLYGVKKSGKDPSVNGAQWWERAPYYQPAEFQGRNVGVACGYELSGGGFLQVLDPDGPEGVSQLSELASAHGGLPDTLTIQSGSGTGLHLYFRTRKQHGGVNLAPNVNTRGKGGQVVAPGCYHYSGGGYATTNNAPIAWAPEWLEEMLSRGARKSFEGSLPDQTREVTREMCAQRAAELGPSHGAYETLIKLSRGEPLAPKGQRHDAVDLRAAMIVTSQFGRDVTTDSYLRLIAPSYPEWGADPLDPVDGAQNWTDARTAFEGAREKVAETRPELDIEIAAFNAQFQPTEPELDTKILLRMREALGNKRAGNALAQRRWLDALIHHTAGDIEASDLPGIASMLAEYDHTLSLGSVCRTLGAVLGQDQSFLWEPQQLQSVVTEIFTKQRKKADASEKRKASYTRGSVIYDPDSGQPLPTAANVQKLARLGLAGKLRVNLRGLRIEARDLPWRADQREWAPWREADYSSFVEWLQDQHSMIKAPAHKEAIECVAEENTVDPFKDWLDSLVWDRQERLFAWLPHSTGVEYSRYHQAIGAKFIRSMVARTYLPGCKVDTKLVLCGLQGATKSTFFRALFPSARYFSNAGSGKQDKDYKLMLHSFVLAEDQEMQTFSRKSVEQDKAFITTEVDTIRPPYARVDRAMPRRYVLCGTSNDTSGFLHDVTGGRRYWPVTLRTLDVKWVRQNAVQLWAEAVHHIKHDVLPHVFEGNLTPVELYSWWLTPEEEAEAAIKQEEHRVKDPLEETFETWLAADWGGYSWYDPTKGTMAIKPAEVPPDLIGAGVVIPAWYEGQRDPTGKLRYVSLDQLRQLGGYTNTKEGITSPEHRMRRALAALGWHHQGRRAPGTRFRVYERPTT